LGGLFQHFVAVRGIGLIGQWPGLGDAPMDGPGGLGGGARAGHGRAGGGVLRLLQQEEGGRAEGGVVKRWGGGRIGEKEGLDFIIRSAYFL